MKLNYKRFSFWKIFWGVLGINLFFGLIAVVAISMMANPGENYHMDDILSWKNAVKQVINITFTTIFAYYAFNYYYYLMVERKNFIYYLRFSILFAIVCFIYYLILGYYFPPKASMKSQVTLGLMIFSYSLTILFFIGISLLIAYFTNLRDEKKQRKVLEEQKMQLEVEKSQANFNFLKAQINPHFLHNTLNFLYAKSLPYSPELSEGILTLSDIMRYALSEGNTKDGKALLKDEIEHVRNVIKINQLRFSNNLNVKFEVNGMLNGATIIPFVLITIVENAFKHGDLKSSDNPIEINLKIEEDQLLFFCRNKKKKGPKEISTGLGLDNIKKRLDLAYGSSYKLIIQSDPDFYSTELIINR